MMYPPELRASNKFARKGIAPSPTNKHIVADTRGIFCFALLLIFLTIACIRQARQTIQHSPDASLNSFQGPGAFSKLEKQMEDNYQVFLRELNDKQKQINELKLAQGQLPAPKKD